MILILIRVFNKGKVTREGVRDNNKKRIESLGQAIEINRRRKGEATDEPGGHES